MRWGHARESDDELTLNTNVYVILRLLGLSCIFVGFGEGVYQQICQLCHLKMCRDTEGVRAGAWSVRKAE